MTPALAQQFPTVIVDSDRLAPAHRSFNASVIQYAGRRLMAYRSHTLAREWCTLHIATLGPDWQPVDDVQIDVPMLDEENGNLEDPRLFHGMGVLWLAWTEAVYRTGNWTCVQRYGQLWHKEGYWRVVTACTPRYGNNNGTAKEKNWQFFWQNDRLFAIYAHSPQLVIELDGETVVNEWRTPGIRWRFGHASGGTPPVPFGPDHLLTFFHAYEPDMRHERRYNMAAALIENKPPFAVTHVSEKPLLVASEREPLAPDERWHPLCVFPCGIIQAGDTWHVSLGVNDCRCAITSIPQSKINLVPYVMQANTNTVRIKLTGNVIIGGYCRKIGDVVEAPKNVAVDLLARNKAILAPEEVAPVITVEESEDAIIPQQPKRRRRAA